MIFLSSHRLRIALASVRMWVVVCITALFLCGIGVFFYFQGKQVMDHSVRERLMSVAAIGAMQFSGEEVEKIRGRSSMDTTGFRSLVERLQRIRSEVPGVRYVYILRRTDNPQELAFVADADALQTIEEADSNKNGIIDPDEEYSLPGDRYSIADIPALQNAAFETPTTDAAITLDQWGATFSGYAPIRTSKGNVVAVLGLDLTASDYQAFLQAIFSTQSFFLFLFGSLLVALFILISFWHGRAEQLARLNDERSWLMQLVLHQVGTPLTIFKWGVESLEEASQRASGTELDEARTNVELMKDGVSRLEHVTEVLLAADKVQRGRYAVHPEDVSLKSIIDETAQAIVPRLAYRKQVLRMEIEEDLHIQIDRKLLAGVIRELLDNAMIYSPNGGTITVIGKRQGAHAEVTVSDQGPGIAKEDLPRVFQRFARGSNAGSFDPNGTGIGLYIARGIIERFGGTIAVSGGAGKGATFTFSLPVR